MARSPLIQAKIYQNQQKKQAQLSQTARRYFHEGAFKAAKMAKEMLATGWDKTYAFEHELLHRMKLIEGNYRMLASADTDAEGERLLNSAKESLGDDRTPLRVREVALKFGRSAHEVLVFHHELAGLTRLALPSEQREALEQAIGQRFPGSHQT